MKQIISKYLRPYFPRMGVGFVIKFLGTVMDLCIPYILAYIIDSVIPTGEKRLYCFGACLCLCVLFLPCQAM